MRRHGIVVGVLVLSGLVFAALPGRAQDRPDLPQLSFPGLDVFSGTVGAVHRSDALYGFMHDAPVSGTNSVVVSAVPIVGGSYVFHYGGSPFTSISIPVTFPSGTFFLSPPKIFTAPFNDTKYQYFYGKFKRDVYTTAAFTTFERFGTVKFQLFEPDRIIRNPTKQVMKQRKYPYVYIYANSIGTSYILRTLTGTAFNAAAGGCKAKITFKDGDANGSINEPGNRAIYNGQCKPSAIADLGLSPGQETLLKKLKLLTPKGKLLVKGSFKPPP